MRTEWESELLGLERVIRGQKQDTFLLSVVYSDRVFADTLSNTKLKTETVDKGKVSEGTIINVEVVVVGLGVLVLKWITLNPQEVLDRLLTSRTLLKNYSVKKTSYNYYVKVVI